MEDGGKGSFRHKTPSYHGGHYASGNRGARNVLTWGELGGLGNLTKCEKISLLGETHLHVEIPNDNSVWILFVLSRPISRKLH